MSIQRDFKGRVGPGGELGLRVIRGGKPPQVQPPHRDITLGEILKFGSPWAKDLSPQLRAWKMRNWPILFRGVPRVLAARLLSIATMHGSLFLVRIDGLTGLRTNYGLVSLRVVTTAAVNFIAADMNDGASDSSTFDYHGLGTGVVAENVTDTGLGTELTTEYLTNNTRPTGTPSNPSANIYRTVATITLDSGTPAVTEHCVLTSATVGAGTALDRSVFAAINLVGANADSIAATYSATFAAGG